MSDRKVICRNLADIPAKPTAHRCGLKTILLANEETVSDVTQIAKTILRKDEFVETHIHLSMDEHYLFIRGEAIMTIENDVYNCSEGTFIMVPSGFRHQLKPIADVEILTIGIAIQ